MPIDTRDNADQIAFWDGEAGRRWAAAQVLIERSLEPFGRALLAKAAPGPGERALDVGCGSGSTTLLLAEAVGATGTAIGVDLSAEMLEQARRRATGKPQLSFQQADAAVWDPSAPFDLIMSRFGVMFFVDPLAAFRHLRELLKPSGRLVFACWRAPDENPWLMLPAKAAAALFPPQPPSPPEAPGPFAFASAKRVTSILEGAGFHQVELTPFDSPVVLASAAGGLDEAVDYAMTLGPTARLLDKAEPPLRAKATMAIRDALAPLVTSQGLAMPGATWLVSARAS